MISYPGLLVLQLVVLIVVFVALLAAFLSALVSVLVGLRVVPTRVARALYPWATWMAGPNIRTAILSRLALAAVRSGDMEEAADYAQRGVRSSPRAGRASKAAALVTLGAVLRAEGRLREARDNFQRSMEVASRGSRVNRARTEINVALISIELGDFDAARSALATVASLAPSGRDRLRFLLASGFLHYLEHDLPAARADFEQGLELARRHPTSILPKFEVDLGYVELRAGRTDEARRLAHAAIDSATRRDQAALPHGLALRGEASLAAGDIDGARDDLRRALAMHRELHQLDSARYAAAVLGLVELRAGNREEGRALLNEARGGQPSVETARAIAELLRELDEVGGGPGPS
jgi:tetratricopeptide (TPR) repeat protein